MGIPAHRFLPSWEGQWDAAAAGWTERRALGREKTREPKQRVVSAAACKLTDNDAERQNLLCKHKALAVRSYCGGRKREAWLAPFRGVGN